MLGLGLGAVIFMYGVADTLMLKPPPYPQGDRIYSVIVIDGQEPGDYDDSMLPLDYLKVREAQTQFEAFGSVYVGTTYLTGDGQAERYDGGFADGYIFAVPGIAPEIGRTIEPRDTIPGAARVVVLGHELWTERFGADPAVLGRTVRVNGQSSEVIGVMPKDYAFPTTADLWVANQEDPTRVMRGARSGPQCLRAPQEGRQRRRRAAGACAGRRADQDGSRRGCLQRPLRAEAVHRTLDRR